MKKQYCDTRGLAIQPKEIETMMNNLGVSEEEVILFLGEDRVNKDGYVASFLSMMESMDEWFVGDRRKDMSITLLIGEKND